MKTNASIAPLVRFFRPSATHFAAFAFCALVAALLCYPQEVKESLLASTLYCLTVLTPSLFPFMALTSFGVHAGVSQVLGNFLGWWSRGMFRLPKCTAAVILMSFIGGYPAGAKGISLLQSQGLVNQKQAGRMLLFCVNPGLAFVVTYVGGGILHNQIAGWLLFFSVTVSGLLLGALPALWEKFPKKELPPDLDQGTEGENKGATNTVGGTKSTAGGTESTAGGTKSTAYAVVASAWDATNAVVKMTACILLFSCLSAILHGTGLFALASQGLCRLLHTTPMEASALVSFLMEVTGGVGDAATFRVSLPYYAFGLAFGGLCVHLQVLSFFPSFPVGKGKFLLFRLLHGLLSAGICYGVTRLLPASVSVSAPLSFAPVVRQSFSSSAGAGLSLLVLSLAFLLIVFPKREKKLK